eukprot:g70693.t1
MRVLLVLIVLVLASTTQAQGVVKLTDKTFKKFKKKNEENGLLVMFFAPWCGHCKKAKPAFIAAAKELTVRGKMGAVDCTVNEAICQEIGIEGYPTFIYFQGHRNYTGQDYLNAEFAELLRTRTKETFMAFMQKMDEPATGGQEDAAVDGEAAAEDEAQHASTGEQASGQAAVEVTDASFAEFLEQHRQQGLLLMFLAPWCGYCKKAKPELEAAAAQLRQDGVRGQLAWMDATANDKTPAQYEAHGYPSFVYFKGDKHFGQQDWINTEFSHVLLHRDQDSFYNFMKSQDQSQHEEL